MDASHHSRADKEIEVGFPSRVPSLAAKNAIVRQGQSQRFLSKVAPGNGCLPRPLTCAGSAIDAFAAKMPKP